jgi:hypothetical protein
MTVAIEFDKIAAQIHQFYCVKAGKEGWKNEFPMPFAELPEFMKADNRAAAWRIGEVLSLAGLRLVANNRSPWTAANQTEIANLIEQNIELLAEGEHEGWTQARLRQGWRLGVPKDTAKREHHLLVPWPQFLDQVNRKQEYERQQGKTPAKKTEAEVIDEQDKDRGSVRNYVAIIAQTEYRIALEQRE